MALAPEQLVERVESVLGDRARAVRHQLGQVVVDVDPRQWAPAVQALKDDTQMGLDYFAFLSAIDWLKEPTETQKSAAVGGGATPGGSSESREGGDGYEAPDGDLIQIVCRLQSGAQGHGITLKTDLDAERPELSSVVSVYGGADWHERECAEMFGVAFHGHPNLTRLYLPEMFEGNPLRKVFALGSRLVKPWPGHVDVEEMPESRMAPAPEAPAEEKTEAPAEAATEAAEAEDAGAEAAPAPEAAAESAAAPPSAEPTKTEAAAPSAAPAETAEAAAPVEAPPAAETPPAAPTTAAPVPAPEPTAAPAPAQPARAVTIEEESLRTGIPVAVLQRMRTARERAEEATVQPQVAESAEARVDEVVEADAAARGATSAPDVDATTGADDEAAIAAESERTGIPVRILQRMWEARKKAEGRDQ